MNILGRGAGANALRERLADVEGPDLVWGRNGVDGLAQLRAFQSAEIPCPEFTTNLSQARHWVREETPVWGRRFHHARGNDIVPYFHRLWSRRDFWVQVLPNVAFELRIHVWDGNAFRTGVKVQTSVPVNPRSRIANLPVRNDRNGWHLKYTQEALDAVPAELRKQAREVAKRAVSVCGYLYGAVDTYVTGGAGDTGTVVGVFEVNTAPALGERTLEAYVTVISEWAARSQPVTSE